jgi:hypothetical protein
MKIWISSRHLQATCKQVKSSNGQRGTHTSSAGNMQQDEVVDLQPTSAGRQKATHVIIQWTLRYRV